MDDLLAFLRARLDEDEAAARDERIWFGPYPETIGEFEGHLVIQDERVLREVAAKREIIAMCKTPGSYDIPEDILLALASVYADHPDYRQDWAEFGLVR